MCGVDLAKTVFTVRATPGDPIKVTKFVAYHTSNGVPGARARRPVPPDTGREPNPRATDHLLVEQREWLDGFWVERRRRTPRRRSAPSRPFAGTCSSSPRHRRARRSRASPRRGSPAPATTATTSGTPRSTLRRSSTYTMPGGGTKAACASAWQMLPTPPASAAVELSQSGALYPVAHDQRRGGLRLLRGRHGAVPHRRRRRPTRSRRTSTPPATSTSSSREGAEILVETARLWADLGFWRGQRRSRTFHIHGVTGPTSTRPSSTTTSTPTSWRGSIFATRPDRALAVELDTPRRYGRLVARTGLDRRRGRRVGRAPPRPCTSRSTRSSASTRRTLTSSTASPGTWRDDARRELPAAAALPPARDLPPPGAQAGRRGAGDVPAWRPVHRRREAPQLRLLRPDHDG